MGSNLPQRRLSIWIPRKKLSAEKVGNRKPNAAVHLQLLAYAIRHIANHGRGAVSSAENAMQSQLTELLGMNGCSDSIEVIVDLNGSPLRRIGGRWNEIVRE